MVALNRITLTNKILYSINIVVCICIIFLGLRIPIEMSIIKRESLEHRPEILSQEKMGIDSIRSYSDYAKLIANRSLFIPIVEELPAPNPQVPSPVLILPQPQAYLKPEVPLTLPSVPIPPPKPKIPLEQRISNLTLIGVISDEDGETAIIQDRRYNKEYFLKKGNTVGEVKIEDVLEDKVILKDGDEMIELRM